MASFGQFKFQMSEALIEQIIEYLNMLDWAPLNRNSIDAQISESSRKSLGVYLLGTKSRESTEAIIETNYVGQSQSAIYDRLVKHARFISDRCGLDESTVFFKAAEVIIFDSIHVETKLIAHFKTKWDKANPNCGWNGSGFGSNDSGGGRDNQKASNFDKKYPIDINIVKDTWAYSTQPTIKKAISNISNSVPYTVRVDRGNLRTRANDLELPSQIKDGSASTYERTLEILSYLPKGWVARVYPVKIIFSYDEDHNKPLANPHNWPPDFNAVEYVVIA